MKTTEQCLLETHGDKDLNIDLVKRAMGLYSNQFKNTWDTDMSKLAKTETDNLIVFFDNGQWMPFNNENWPFAEVKAWIKLPDLPIHLCNGYGISEDDYKQGAHEKDIL